MRRFSHATMLAVLGLLAATEAGAQGFRGIVRDSTSGQPISGAVIVLRDSGGVTLGRNITNERGEYRLTAPATARHIRVLRIGFRSRELSVSSSTNDATALDIVMTPVAARLEPLRIQSDVKCPRRSDRRAALALLEQAQAGLLTTVVAGEANPARLVLLKFDRTMVGTTDRIERQTVRIDSVRRSPRSYQAARHAADFVEHGFAVKNGEETTYFGPDADVLLDEQFTSGYCFHLHDPDTKRPHEVGLAFVPAGHRSGRVDIDGTLWVDTATHALREIEFRYLGIDGAENLRLGGRISFREMENGVVLIDRWVLRLPILGADTTYSIDRTPIIRARPSVREVGGEVASASWPDGHTWTAKLVAVPLRLPSEAPDRTDPRTTIPMTSLNFAAPVAPMRPLEPSSPSWRERLLAFAHAHLEHSAWGVAHAQRDYELTLRLAEAERVPVDSDAIYAAAYLHDMGAFPEFAQAGVDHGVRSGQLVGEQLTALGFPTAKIALVQDIVEHHMHYHTRGSSPEAVLFRDADTLDFLGAIGIARICSVTTRHRWATDLPTAIATIRENAKQLPASLHSAAARREAEGRVAEMRKFLDAIDAQVGTSRAY